ncbi:MAG TPA: hypothetical protein VGO13_10950 [Solirubrobacterales bacterium]|jgi:hypothetical protein|nr:hypothetical protein [Solirubrobacterales bacterium]
METDLDKTVKELKKELKAEKAERQELLDELRKSRPREDEKVSSTERMRRGYDKAERRREGKDDDDDE